MNGSRILRALQNSHFVFCVLCFLTALWFVGDLRAYDLWWHLKAGEMILQTGAIPRTDVFSFTRLGAPWVYHSWLAGVVFYVVYASLGAAGLIMLLVALVSGSLMLGWTAARRRGVGLGVASLLVVAAAFQLWARALTRPHLFSFVLFMLFYLVAQRAFENALPERTGRGGRVAEGWYLWGGGGKLLLLPLMILLWANLHAGMSVGFLLLGAFGVAEMIGVATLPGRGPYLRALCIGPEGVRFRAMLASGVLCLAAAMVTPYGPRALLYPVYLFREVKLVKEVLEWQPLPLESDFLVCWFLLLFCALVMVRSLVAVSRAGELRHNVRQFCADFFLMFGFGLMMVQSRRNLEWFMLLATPVVGYHLSFARERFGYAGDERAMQRRESIYVVAALLCGLLLAARQVRRTSATGLGVSETVLPVRACSYISRSPIRGNVFNAYEWGGYVIWSLWPRTHVFADGRCDVYGDRVLGDWLRIVNGEPEWQATLASYEVDYLLLPHRKRRAAHYFQTDEWRCVYWDETALVAVGPRLYGKDLSGIEYYPLSNPAVFEQRLQDTPPQEVLAEVERVLTRQKRNSIAWAMKARCLLKMAETDEKRRSELGEMALRAAKQALSLNDANPFAWEALGEWHRAAGDVEEAVRCFKKARSLE
jgi:hypothetical protein